MPLKNVSAVAAAGGSQSPMRVLTAKTRAASGAAPHLSSHAMCQASSLPPWPLPRMRISTCSGDMISLPSAVFESFRLGVT
jgi:hypothetical protein